MALPTAQATTYDRTSALSPHDRAPWFQPMFSEAPDARLLVDMDGRIVAINAAGAGMTGFVDNELAGRLLSAVCRSSRPEETGSLLDRIRLAPVFRAEGWVMTREGEERCVEITSYRLDGPDSTPVLLVEWRDRSRFRAIQEELGEMRIRVGEAERLVRLGSWSFFPSEGRIVWSDEVFRIAGFAIEEGEPDFEGYLQRIHPADAALFLDVVQRSLYCDESYTIKHRLLMPDGAVRWVISSGRAAYDERGQLTKLIGTIQDVTEQEAFLQATRASEQRLRFHIEQSPVAYIEWDTNFTVVEWNPAAERTFGFKREDVLGRLPAIIPPEEQERVQAIVASLLNGEGGTHSVNRNVTRDGKSITCEWYNTSLRSEDGRIVGVSSLVQDVSQRYDAEQALMDYTRELKMARDLAESATRAKSAFLANMSHEIRTPLNGVIGMASLLSETELSSEQSDFVSTILVSSETLLGIINDVLDFSKIEAGKIELEHVPVDLSDLIEGSLDLLATRAAERDLELLYELDPHVPKRILADPTRLRQILVNLLSNGVKFTERGEIEVRVSAARGAAGRCTLRFSVRDTGIGIPAEKIDRLFRSFSQVDASTTRKYGGTGLGLSISYKLAELMGGTMWVESEEGVGTTFHCTIVADPVAEDAGVADRTFAVARRVLLVEPHPRSRVLLSQRLSAMNVFVEACASAEEAASWLRSTCVDALLLDSRLPPEAFETIRHVIASSCVHVPILAITPMGGDSSHRALPADVFLHRPVRAQNLFAKLQETFAVRPADVYIPATGLSLARVLVAEKHPLHQRLVIKMLGDLGCSAEVVDPADALAAGMDGGNELILLGMDAIERAAAADPALRFEGPAHVVALAMHLDADRRRAWQAIGVANVIQLPLQSGALQRVVQRYMLSMKPADGLTTTLSA